MVEQIERDPRRDTPGVDDWFMIGGLLDARRHDRLERGARVYVVFTPWEERHRPEPQPGRDPRRPARRSSQQIQEAIVFAFPPPAIHGLGVAGGFQMQVEDRGGVGLDDAAAGRRRRWSQRRQRADRASTALNSTFRAGVPQLYADVDRVKAKSAGRAARRRLRHAAGVPRLGLRQRLQQVRPDLPGARPGRPAVPRSSPDDIRRLEVRNRQGKMVPLGTLVDVQRRARPADHHRYNLYPSASITGEAAPGLQLRPGADADGADGRRASCPPSMGYEWTGMSYQEKQVGGEAIYVFALAVLLVYLVLAAQYESWIMPAAVILVVPLALLGTVVAVAVRGMDNNVYTQIGIVLIIALASKNAILIVEFARELRAAASDRRGGGRGGAAAVPADPDDVVRVHPRRVAAGRSPPAPAPRAGGRSAPPCSAA